MENDFVRINEIIIEGFKNTLHGVIQIPSAMSKTFAVHGADVLGIYGQNGSGKTAVVEAMAFVQNLLSGRPLRPDTEQYISKEQNSCIIKVIFDLSAGEHKSRVEYQVEIKRIGYSNFRIERESISSKVWEEEKYSKKKVLLDFVFNGERISYGPNYRIENLFKEKIENEINLEVAVKLAYKEYRSFIFNEESMKIFLSASASVKAERLYVIFALYTYALDNLFVIQNSNSGLISLNLLPLAYNLSNNIGRLTGTLPISLDKPTLLAQREYDLLQRIISGINITLTTLIPGLSVGVHDLGEQLLKDGATGHAVQLVSIRGDVKIPLQYESQGIIKIISILNALMYVFHNPSSCLFIDELDSGVFEYLLGELLSFFAKNAKGQMIFTSHNLRALEVLPTSNILFSTANPQNRYIRFKGVKKNNNLRDFYLRSIKLGGQQEDIYAETDTNEIGRAFRRVERAAKNGDEN